MRDCFKAALDVFDFDTVVSRLSGDDPQRTKATSRPTTCEIAPLWLELGV
jgi:hypothetical protein